MVTSNVSLVRDAAQVAALLDSPEVSALIADLEATWWTGRPGYPIHAMVGMSGHQARPAPAGERHRIL